MTEFFLTVFIFVGVIAVTALVFGGWILVNVVRGIWGMLGLSRRNQLQRLPQQQWRGGPQPQSFVPMPPTPFVGNAVGTIQCGLPGCRHINPATARFCRRCGHAFPQAQRATAATRRAAYA